MDQYSEVRTTTIHPTGTTRTPEVAPGRTMPGSEAGQTEVGELMEQAKETATKTADEVGGMIQKQLDTGVHMAGERLSGAVKNLTEVADTLEERGNTGASKLVHSATDRAERMTHYLENADSERMLSDANRYAREHMWVVVAGGALLGVVASRFLKASLSTPATHSQQSPYSQSGYQSSYRTM